MVSGRKWRAPVLPRVGHFPGIAYMLSINPIPSSSPAESWPLILSWTANASGASWGSRILIDVLQNILPEPSRAEGD